MANDFSGDPNCLFCGRCEVDGATGASLTAAASTEYVTCPAWKAFDADVTSYWLTDFDNEIPCWLSYSWGGTVTKTVASYTVVSYAYAATRAPKDWTFDGYDGSWHVLDTVTGETAWGGYEERNFAVDTPAAYTAYRLSVSANNGDTYWTEVCLLRLLDADGLEQSHIMSADTMPIGALVDSQGNHDFLLTGVALPAVDTGDYREGAAALDFEFDNGNYAQLEDVDADWAMPFIDGSTNYDFSLTCWFKAEYLNISWPTTLWSKSLGVWTGGHKIMVETNDVVYTLDFTVTGAQSPPHPTLALVTGRWYHLACTYNYADGHMHKYLWGVTEDALLLDVGEDFAPIANGHPVCDTAPHYIGNSDIPGPYTRPYDGLLDEVTIWGKALTAAEVEAIRLGLYAYSSSSSSSSTSSSSSLSVSSSSSDSSSSSFVPPAWPTLSTGVQLADREEPAADDVTMPLGNGRTAIRPRFTRRPHRRRVACRLLSLADYLALETFYLVTCARSKYTFEFTDGGLGQTWLMRFDPDEPPQFGTEPQLPEKFYCEAVLLEETVGTYGPGGYGAHYYDS